MKREHLITYLRVAGYHNDAATYTRLYIENKISHGAAKKAFAEGVAQRERGVPCDCRTCKAERGAAARNARQSSMPQNFGTPDSASTARARLQSANFGIEPGRTFISPSENGAEMRIHTESTEWLAGDTIETGGPAKGGKADAAKALAAFPRVLSRIVEAAIDSGVESVEVIDYNPESHR